MAVFTQTDGEIPDLAEHERRYAWVSDLADNLGWHEVVRYRASFREHINMKNFGRTEPGCATRRAVPNVTARDG